jgi:CO/xanthine dehydrogenase Mo-binding subunit
MADYRFIGKATPRKDGPDIVTGRAKFLNDLSFPNMLYGKVLRSPHAHALIRDIDGGKAKKLAGVEAVLTYRDVPDWKGGLPPHIRVLDSKVRFVGDAVALVAARTEDIAGEALGLLKVDYEVLPAVYDVEAAVRPDAPQLYAEFPGNVLPPDYNCWGPGSLQEVSIGDVEQGFKDADSIIEGTYRYESIPNPLPPEHPSVIAEWEGSNKLKVWSATQGPYGVTVFLARMIPGVDVHSIGGQCGSSYGSKLVLWHQIFYAAALSRVTHTPVKVSYTADEHFAAFTMRLGSRIHGKMGIKKDGRVTAVSCEWLVNTGASSDYTQGMVAVGLGEVQLMIRCPNWRIAPKVVCTNRNPSGVVRGFGGQELECAFEPILTMAMEKAGVDPVEFHKTNYVKAGDGYCWRDGKWWVSRGIDYSRAIDRGAETFGWKDKWKGWLQPTSVNGPKRRGVGVGIHGNADVGEDVSEAYVRLNPDGSAVLYSCVTEHGTGQRSSLCKMVAEVLNIPLERVYMTPPDSQINPFEVGPGGSRGTYAIGGAVINAAQNGREKLFEWAAPMLNTAPEDLNTEDGFVYVKAKPEVRIPWIAVIGFGRTCLGYGRFEADYSLANMLMIFAEVEVDTETGKVDLIRVVPVTDVGQIIDPPSLKNQINGCLGTAGLDSALFEETVLDSRMGRILTANMIDYKWRSFTELPEMEQVILETPFPSHRFHAIGVGEITPAPGPSAVLMAVSNAVGKRMHDYPLTPDKVLKVLGRIQ